MLASLNHPNIAVIYSLEESVGSQALVLELVEGRTLADRIAHGPVPLGEALTIAHRGRGPRASSFTAPPTQQIMVVSYAVEGAAFRADKPRLWSEGRYRRFGISRPFDLHPDGRRFALAPATPTDTKQDHVTVVFNVFDELRRIAPVGNR